VIRVSRPTSAARRALCVLVLAASLPIAAGSAQADTWPPPGSVIVDKLVAIVNQDPITLFELRRAAAPFVAQVIGEVRTSAELNAKLMQVQQEVLDNLINDILIHAEARRMGITVEAPQVEAHIERIRTANGWSEDQLAEQLRRLGFASIADYRRHTEREMMKSQAISIRVGSRVKLDEREVEQELQRRLGAGSTVEERRAAHVLLKVDPLATRDATEGVRALMEAQRERIIAGEVSFEDVARAISEDTGTQRAGGDLGWFTRGDFDPDFEAAAFALPAGEVSQPIRTQFGWHLIKVISVRDRQVTASGDLEKIRMEIRFQRRQQELERLYLQWVRSLRSQAFVEVKDPELERHGGPSVSRALRSPRLPDLASAARSTPEGWRSDPRSLEAPSADALLASASP